MNEEMKVQEQAAIQPEEQQPAVMDINYWLKNHKEQQIAEEDRVLFDALRKAKAQDDAKRAVRVENPADEQLLAMIKRGKEAQQRARNACAMHINCSNDESVKIKVQKKKHNDSFAIASFSVSLVALALVVISLIFQVANIF